MHRMILNAPKNTFVDHINHEGLDNRKKNLRLATPSQNASNMRKRKNTKSRYKGVSFCQNQKKFYAQIMTKGKRIHLGYFKDQTTAAKEYDKAAKKYHRQFASLNFVERK